MAIKPRKSRRKRMIHVKGGIETPAQRQQRTAVKYIMGNPQYPLILKSIRDGTPNKTIAEFCINHGHFEINEKTAISYLQYFKKCQPGLCKPQERGSDELVGYDYEVTRNAAILDEENELLKLIAVQKVRLGITFRNEREVGALMSSGRKDVEELRNLITDLAKLRGRLGSTIDVNMRSYSDNVRSDLRSVDQDEVQRGAISTLVSELSSVLTND